jgi:hypothetical protein
MAKLGPNSCGQGAAKLSFAGYPGINTSKSNQTSRAAHRAELAALNNDISFDKK